jgi:hypothetical protein
VPDDPVSAAGGGVLRRVGRTVGGADRAGAGAAAVTGGGGGAEGAGARSNEHPATLAITIISRGAVVFTLLLASDA